MREKFLLSRADKLLYPINWLFDVLILNRFDPIKKFLFLGVGFSGFIVIS
jgi:hypothetical protein